MRGIFIKLERSINNYLWRILKHVNIIDFTWYIEEQEIYPGWIEPEYWNESDIFPKRILSGQELSDYINEQYFIMHVTMLAFPAESDIVRIITYSDLCNSKCFFHLVIVDRIEAYIFCKDEKVLEAIRAECNDNNMVFSQYLDNLDGETRM